VQPQTQKLSKKKTANVVVVSFSGALQQAAAQNLSEYHLVTAGKDKKLGTPDDKPARLVSAVYNATAHTVTLTRGGKLPKQALQLTITASGLLDSQGRPIDGNKDGQPGGNFQTTFRG
jgi:hypothetical protein